MEKKTKPAAPTPGLWKKINIIQTESAKVFKDGMATFGKSEKAIATIESVLDTYLPLCGKHGVSVVPVSIEVLMKEFRPNRYKEDELHLLAMCKYKVVDADSGESHEFSILSHGTDKQDKATGKLLAYALKYAYYQLFSARRGDDDPDVNRDDETERKPLQKKDREPEQCEVEPAKDDKPDEALAAKRKEQYDEAVAEIKGKYDTKEAADKKVVPGGKEYKAHVDSIVKHIKDEEVRKHVSDFSLFHWQCLDLAGNPDLAAVKKHFEKGKARMSKGNIDFIEKQIKRREAAAK